MLEFYLGLVRAGGVIFVILAPNKWARLVCIVDHYIHRRHVPQGSAGKLRNISGMGAKTK